jgi:hypothetical protein
MTRFLKGVLAVALVSVVAANAQAGTFSVTPSVVGYYDAAFNPIPAPVPGTNPGVPVVIEVAVDMTVDSLGAGEAGFANAGFSIMLNGLTDLAQWGPNTATVDSNGALPGGIVPLWATNVDGGTPGDLQGILVSIAGGVTSANDPRRKVGQAGGVPGYMGTIFVQWEGTGLATLSLQDILTSANTTTGSFVDSGSAPSTLLSFGSDIPEPSTIAMAGLSLIGLAFRRRAA